MNYDYLYVFDYSTVQIYKIKVPQDVQKNTEDILYQVGLRIDTCITMWSCDTELNVIEKEINYENK